MKILYIADDGTQFDDEFECEEYEYKQKFHYLDNILIIDDQGNEFYGEQLFESHVYNCSNEVFIKTESAYKEFIEISEYCGWCDFYEIPGPGHYKYKSGPRSNDHWEKLNSSYS